MLKINSKVRIESLDGAMGDKFYEGFIDKDAIVLRKDDGNITGYILDVDGDELLIDLLYDEIYDYETGEYF